MDVAAGVRVARAEVDGRGGMAGDADATGGGATTGDGGTKTPGCIMPPIPPPPGRPGATPNDGAGIGVAAAVTVGTGVAGVGNVDDVFFTFLFVVAGEADATGGGALTGAPVVVVVGGGATARVDGGGGVNAGVEGVNPPMAGGGMNVDPALKGIGGVKVAGGIAGGTPTPVGTAGIGGAGVAGDGSDLEEVAVFFVFFLPVTADLPDLESPVAAPVTGATTGAGAADVDALNTGAAAVATSVGGETPVLDARDAFVLPFAVDGAPEPSCEDAAVAVPPTLTVANAADWVVCILYFACSLRDSARYTRSESTATSLAQGCSGLVVVTWAAARKKLSAVTSRPCDANMEAYS
jgi:hypothetical protein